MLGFTIESSETYTTAMFSSLVYLLFLPLFDPYIVPLGLLILLECP
jgi:hypothetical protein